ncbi:MAG: alpha/beta fold hydrolase [Gemmatimonadales bacterium]|jgi:pimeloyl-ACP methyl ester carboxylesterase
MPADETSATLDTLVDVGGHRLHLVVHRGERPVTVLFEAGGGADAGAWGTVPERLAARSSATVVAYDRAGLGRSELGPEGLSPADEIDDVRAAMRRLSLPQTTIVVGHSYGAMLALAHAERYPDAVSGLVLVDPMNPAFASEESDMLAATVPNLPESPAPRDLAVQRMARSMDSLTAALLDVEPRLRVPMIVVSAGRDWWGSPEVDATWKASHVELASPADRRRVVSEASDHDIPNEDPDAVVDAILALLDG